MKTKPYSEQIAAWPPTGRHILAHYDTDSITVYQAYKPTTALFTVEHQRFGGDPRAAWSFNRMSWIKPNFLWMMYRSGWAGKPGQEHVLAIRLRRRFFDEILSLAVMAQFDERRYPSQEQWEKALQNSEVRLQWDPDHTPQGHRTERRAIQLGLCGTILRRYAQEEILSVVDITPFVHEQRANVGSAALVIPEERIYRPAVPQTIENIGLDGAG